MAILTAKTAAALVVGNELLSGKTQETNLKALATTLRALGIRLQRAIVVNDQIDEIASDIVDLSQRFDAVFTSGGVGPTHDDVTLEAVARAFKVGVAVHPRIEQLLRDTYKDRFTEGHLRMALVPEGAQLIVTDEVTWPTVVMGNVWIMPGVPEIFRMKLAVVRAHLRGPVEFVSRAVFTQLDEGALKPLLDEVVAAHPGVEVGSYPKLFDRRYKTKVTFDGESHTLVDEAARRFIEQLPAGEPQNMLSDES